MSKYGCVEESKKFEEEVKALCVSALIDLKSECGHCKLRYITHALGKALDECSAALEACRHGVN